MANYKVAYGKKKNISTAIESGRIPPGCIILTEDSNEIFFYDLTRKLVTYESRTNFNSLQEAERWIKKYDYSGKIITVREGNRSMVYVIDYSGNLSGISSSAASIQAQADYLIDDPNSPAYIKNKPTSFPITFIEGLEEALASKIQLNIKAVKGSLILSDGNGNLEGSETTLQSIMSTINKKVEIVDKIVLGALMVSDGSGGLKHSELTPDYIFSSLEKKVEITDDRLIEGALMISDGAGGLRHSDIDTQNLLETLSKKVEISDPGVTGALMLSDGSGGLIPAEVTPQEIFSTLSKKVEVEGSVSPGSLMVATEDGKLRCCGITTNDILKKEDIIVGTTTSSTTLNSSGVYIVQIPEDVQGYPSLHVYHNGMLLVENTHYTIADKFITLIGHSTYGGDIFTFVGYGATGNLVDTSHYHTHSNKSILDSITKDMVDAWNASSPSTTVFVSREELFGSDGLILSTLLPEMGPSSAQENVIEEVAIGGALLPIVNKRVTIPIGNEESLGVVKSSREINKVYIEEDGTMSLNKIDTDRLVVSEGDELILVSGDSTK